MLVQGGRRSPQYRCHGSSAGGARGKQGARCPKVRHPSSNACRTELLAETSAYGALNHGGSWALQWMNGLPSCVLGTEVERTTAEEAGQEAAGGERAAGVPENNAAASRPRENSGCTPPVGHLHLWASCPIPPLLVSSTTLAAGATVAAEGQEKMGDVRSQARNPQVPWSRWYSRVRFSEKILCLVFRLTGHTPLRRWNRRAGTEACSRVRCSAPGSHYWHCCHYYYLHWPSRFSFC